MDPPCLRFDQDETVVLEKLASQDLLIVFELASALCNLPRLDPFLLNTFNSETSIYLYSHIDFYQVPLPSG